jgi:hypothetical protein
LRLREDQEGGEQGERRELQGAAGAQWVCSCCTGITQPWATSQTACSN